MVSNKLGAKAPFSPDIGYKFDFLTQEMVRWYYQTCHTIDIQLCKLDDKTYGVDILELVGSQKTTRSFTIGKAISNEIVRAYNFYH